MATSPVKEILRLHDLKGHALRALDGEIGKLRQVYFDDESWVVRYLVVHTGSWLLGRQVLIAPRVVLEVDEEDQTVHVDLTRAQVEKSPPVEEAKPVSRHYEEAYYRYYGWQPYWPGGAGAPMAVPPPQTWSESQWEPPPNPRLRSSDEVCGYHIHARDGKIGHVKDLLLSAGEWKLRYLEVDTRNWLPGRRVLVAPAWIEKVSWVDREVYLSLMRDAVKSAPPYDPSQPIGPDDEIRLFEHYGQAAKEGRASHRSG